jgi:hypothetical protein
VDLPIEGGMELASLDFVATWLIFEARHPFRNPANDDSRRQVLRLKLFIRAENHGLEQLDLIQQQLLEDLSREPESYEW